MSEQQPNLIAAARKCTRITKQRLATELGISEPSLQELELRDAEGTISINELSRVADALGLELIYGFAPRGKRKSGRLTRRGVNCNGVSSRPRAPLRGQYRAIAGRLESREPFRVPVGYFDPSQGRVTIGGHDIILSPLEFLIFETIALAYPRPALMSQIIRSVWREDDPGLSNNLRVAVSKIRRKLEQVEGVTVAYSRRAYLLVLAA